jgi:addiction module HigA family antidote
MLPTNRPPTHPGEILNEEFLKPKGWTQEHVAKTLGISLQRVNGVVKERRAVTAETALLLARLTETSPQFWMNLQTNYDLWHAREALKKKESAAMA